MPSGRKSSGNGSYKERKNILTDDFKETIIRLLKAGNYLETACVAAGCSSRALREWRIAYRNGEEVAMQHKEFFEGINQAIAIGETLHLSRVERAAEDGVWQAAAWVLERRWSERWAKRDIVEVRGTNGDLSKLTDEELKALTSRTKKRN